MRRLFVISFTLLFVAVAIGTAMYRQVQSSLPPVTAPVDQTVVSEVVVPTTPLATLTRDHLEWWVSYQVQTPVGVKYVARCPCLTPTVTSDPPADIQMVIDEAGNVVNAFVSRPIIFDLTEDIPMSPFEKKVTAAVRKWKYEPTLVAGEPVRIVVRALVYMQEPPPFVTMTGTIHIVDKIQTTTPKRLDNEPTPHIDYSGWVTTAQVEGTVVIEATIDEEGNVTNAKVTKSETPLLNQPALDAVQKWKYEPALLNGKPVPVLMTVTVNFKK
jgi:TonB family protein